MKVYVADFETTPFDYSKEVNYLIHSRFICFIEIFTNKRLYFDIENKGLDGLKNFIYSLCSVKNPIKIYFHNLRFDIAFLYDSLPKEYNYDVIFSGNKLINLRVFKTYKRNTKKGFRYEKKTILDIRDSLPLFVNSIQKLGKAVLLPKLEQDYFQEKIDDNYIEYCYRDIEIVKRALALLKFMLLKYFDYEIEIVDLPLTIASLGKRVLHYIMSIEFSETNNKKTYNKLLNILYKDLRKKVDNPLFLLTYHKSIDDIELDFRNNYFGGRVEVFDFNICKDGFYNDVNSEYPSVMLENLFPIPPYKKVIFINSIEAWNEYINNKFVFACKCRITEYLDIPLVPTKMEIKGSNKIIYAKGIKESILFRKEIDYLISLNQGIEILECYYCSIYLPIFKSFIGKGYKLKSSFLAETFENYFGKIFMNSVYGKFAEKKEKEQIEIINVLDKNMNESELNKLSFTEKGIIKRDLVKNDNLKTNIVFSCMICALGRLKIHQYICKVNDSRYTDTDSIVSKTLIENSKEIGKMKPEFSFKLFQPLGCKEYIIINDKNYIFVKMKGFGKIDLNCKDLDLTQIQLEKYNEKIFDNFVSDFYEGKKQSRMVGFLESFKRNLPFNTILVFQKFKESSYDKRWINKDLTTRAFHLQNDNFNDMIKNNSEIMLKLIESYFKD